MAFSLVMSLLLRYVFSSNFPFPLLSHFSNYSLFQQDLEFIITNKVTHIINCAGRQLANYWESLGVTYLTYNWLDSQSQVWKKPPSEILISKISIRLFLTKKEILWMKSTTLSKKLTPMGIVFWSILKEDKVVHAVSLLLISWKGIITLSRDLSLIEN